jgi:pyrroloquinoline quinone biosynthesis protein D
MSAIDLESRPSLAARTRLQIDPVTGEPVLLYPEGVLVLNETAHEILKHCDGKMTVREIVDLLAAEYESPPGELTPDICECLAMLASRSLMTLQR